MKHLETFEYYRFDPEDERIKPESGVVDYELLLH